MKITAILATTLLAFVTTSTALPTINNNVGADTDIVEKREAFRNNKYGRWWPGMMGPQADEEAGGIGVDHDNIFTPQGEGEGVIEKREAFRNDKYGRWWPGMMGPQADDVDVDVDTDEGVVAPLVEGEGGIEKREAFRNNKYGRWWPGMMGPQADEGSK